MNFSYECFIFTFEFSEMFFLVFGLGFRVQLHHGNNPLNIEMNFGGKYYEGEVLKTIIIITS